jgi:transcriptional regulator with XRE-family HTH domain
MREAAGVSQTALAAYVGISRRTLARVEAGERALRPPERILSAKALSGSLATFVVSCNDNGKERHDGDHLPV